MFMALTTYKKKRSFSKTPEPVGGRSTETQLHFVVQKHAASHLHYDFRLEMKGVLKSWAVPKGPSTDPSVKRLAMMVEDHPYDYRNFEGIIPKGQYGGGTVIVWDEGFYEPVVDTGNDKKSTEKELLRQLYSGKLKFRLKGKKLKGEWALVKAGGRGENAWLLMKLDDKYASATDITKKEKSVQSGKTIAQITATTTNVWGQSKNSGSKNKEEPVKPNTAAMSKTAAVKKTVEPKVLSKGSRAAFPKDLKPMLATLVDKPFDAPGWLYEIKWDGYRALAYLRNGKVALRSRNNKSFDEKFYAIHDALKQWKINAVVDGEIIVTDEKGMANFGKLQNWRSEADGLILFYVFDIVWLEGRSLLQLPLSERRKILEQVIPESDQVLLSQEFETNGLEFYETAEKLGLEGIMAKKADSVYVQDRSKDWLKIKTQTRQEVVIGGFTRNEGTAKSFSSLLVGVYEKGRLQYAGKIGTGFTEKMQKEMMQQFKPLIISEPPFSYTPDVNKPSRFRPNPPRASVTWLKPELVCEVSYREITSDGVMRHPSFQGMRIDKPAKKVVLEKEKKTESVVKPASMSKTKTLIKAPKKQDRKTFLNPTDESQVRKIGGHELTFNHLSKWYWPKEKISKRDMLNYYYQVAPYILPYLKDRPQSLNRFPNGINGISFYQKDVTGKVPDWIPKVPYETEGIKKNFMLCNDEATLLYMASLGCIELNPWSSTVKRPDNPDWCIIDLDPDKNHFDQVIETARVTKQLLDAAAIDGYCKTSGSTGIHIYIPLGAKYDYEASKEFGRLIATLVNEQLPDFTSIERLTSRRKGKLYIDFLQNRPQATLASAYSLRPKPGATVSMPIHWDELKKGLKMSDFNIFNAMERIRSEGDIFKPVVGKGINMKAAITKLSKL
jgi:bifunctional non-homologous end joining protein LigD